MLMARKIRFQAVNHSKMQFTASVPKPKRSESRSTRIFDYVLSFEWRQNNGPDIWNALEALAKQANARVHPSETEHGKGVQGSH